VVSLVLEHGKGNALPDAVAVYVAQVPDVNHVPALIRHPFCDPPVIAFRKPDPENGAPGVPVGAEPPVVVVVVDVGGMVVPPDLGRYLIPVEAQLDDWPTGLTGTN
jgi:hypothetical protein